MGLLLMHSNVTANDKKTKTTVCSNPHPDKLCSAANICGSSTSPCILEVRHTGGGDDASVTPNIPNFPKNSTICIAPARTETKAGKTVIANLVPWDLGSVPPRSKGY